MTACSLTVYITGAAAPLRCAAHLCLAELPAPVDPARRQEGNADA